jgi:hypothetical protein
MVTSQQPFFESVSCLYDIVLIEGPAQLYGQFQRHFSGFSAGSAVGLQNLFKVGEFGFCDLQEHLRPVEFFVATDTILFPSFGIISGVVEL